MREITYALNSDMQQMTLWIVGNISLKTIFIFYTYIVKIPVIYMNKNTILQYLKINLSQTFKKLKIIN